MLRNRNSIPAFLTACLLSFSPCCLADNPWGAATSGMKSLYGSVASLLQIVLGIGAVVVLVEVVLKFMKEEREAATKLIWWLLGLAIGFAMLSVLRGLEF